MQLLLFLLLHLLMFPLEKKKKKPLTPNHLICLSCKKRVCASTPRQHKCAEEALSD